MSAYPTPSKPTALHRPATVAALRQAAVRYFSPAALTEAWGDHLDKFPWQTFETYTFPGWPTMSEAGRAIGDVHRWIRHKQGHRSEWFQVAELQARGAVHWHVLRTDCGDVRRLSIMDYWHGKYGRARVQPYDPALGARYYLCQYVASDYRAGSLELLCDVSRGLKRLLAAGSDCGSDVPTLTPAPRVQSQAVR